ncbi:molybdopterin-dependent oxidoreductase [Nocardia sp. NBC_01499]
MVPLSDNSLPSARRTHPGNAGTDAALGRPVRTYCRNCEALCGMTALVNGPSVLELRPDPRHAISHGYLCRKGIAMAGIQHDDARVLHPLHRTDTGDFEQVSWEQAVADIARRLDAIVEESGPDALAWYLGNPAAFSPTHLFSALVYMRLHGSRQLYSSISQDGAARFAASALLYDDPTFIGIPDIERLDLIVIIGANPFTSNGSQLVMPNIQARLRAVVNRGGRVIVIDPRRTDTADAFEHIQIRPGTDVWLLSAVLRLILESDEFDIDYADIYARGIEILKSTVAGVTLEETARRTAVSEAEIVDLADAIAKATRMAVYGRTGTCTSAEGTLVTFLMDALNILTGNMLDSGGVLAGWTPWPMRLAANLLGIDGYDRYRSRIGRIPEVLGFMPAIELWTEIATRGVRALFVSAGNPVLTVPGTAQVKDGLSALELFVSIDLYVNESNRNADYILPATTWLERADSQFTLLPLMARPFVQSTQRVVLPRGQAREEREIIRRLLWAARPRSITRRAISRLLAVLLSIDIGATIHRLNRALTMLSRGNAAAEHGHAGISLRRAPRGLVRHIRRHGRVDLAPGPIVARLSKVFAEHTEPDRAYPMLMIGRRERTSLNSWLHLPTKRRGAPTLQLAPQDAQALAVDDGDRVRVSSRDGQLIATVEISDRLLSGVACLPHGWASFEGHGCNVNNITPDRLESVDKLSGMARLNAVDVRISATDAFEI